MSWNLASECSDVAQQALVSPILEPLISKWVRSKSVVDFTNQATFYLPRHTTIRSLTKTKQDVFSVIEPSSIRLQAFASWFSYCAESERKKTHLAVYNIIVCVRKCWAAM